jgi:hypothetical protein
MKDLEGFSLIVSLRPDKRTIRPMKTENRRIVKEVSITLPMPPASLHAHAKGNWRAKSQATARAREAAFWATRQAYAGVTWERAEIDYLFFVPDRRRRDAANLVAAMKAAIDGVVDAKLIVDDCWERLAIGAVCVELDRERPRVELVFRRPE